MEMRPPHAALTDHRFIHPVEIGLTQQKRTTRPNIQLATISLIL